MSGEWLLDVEDRVMAQFYHAIGVVVVRWAIAEESMKELTAACSDIRNEVASEALVLNMPNMSLVHMLSTIAKESFEPDLEYFREHLLWACKVFDACRENRNLFSHLSLSPIHFMDRNGVTYTAERAVLHRETAKGQRRSHIQEVHLQDIRDIADEILHLTGFLRDLIEAHHGSVTYRGGVLVPLPSKPPLPHRRSQTLRPWRQAGRSPPLPSEE
ncbi:hypothetical protein [Candidatus Filomicrobium marinum]|nr:hypothetical protein [Candidatus Filomicrobium marinum]